MREITEVAVDVDIQPGMICVSKAHLAIIEQYFGEQSPIKSTQTLVCLDAIRSRRFFRAVVFAGEIADAYNIIPQDDKKSWVVDVPDMSEFLDSAEDVVKALALLTLTLSAPLKVKYRTYVEQAVPNGVQGVYSRTWYEGVLAMKYTEEDTYAVQGWTEMVVYPEQYV